MRFFSKTVLLILVFSVFAIQAAFPGDTLHFAIRWLPSIPSWFPSDSASGKVLLYFENARYNMNGLPEFSSILPEIDNCSEVNVHIISLSFDTVPVSEKYSNLEDFPGELDITSGIAREAGKNYSRLSVIPVVRKDDKLLLLKAFSVEFIKTGKVTSKKSSIQRWKNTSVLSNGTWKKIAVSKTGVYKLTYSDLSKLGFSGSSGIRIFGNGGIMLPEKFSGAETDDLKEIPVYISKGSDGVFNEGDYVLFYAEGPVTWTYDRISRMFVHSKHLYSGKICYFLTSGIPAVVPDAGPVVKPEDLTVSTFVDHEVHEENLFNLIKSGRNWTGEHFAIQNSRSLNFSFPDAVDNSTFTVEGEVLARSSTNTAFTIRNNGNVLANQTMYRVYIDDETSNYADSKKFRSGSLVSGNNLNMNVTFDNRGDNSAEGWLDYLRLNVKRKLKFNGDQLLFRDTSGLFQSKTALYQVENGASDLLLWDVTDINGIKNIKYNLTGTRIAFKAFTDSLHQYVLFDPAKTFTPDFFPEGENTVENQDLHSLSDIEMIIISPAELLSQAQELAWFHEEQDQLRTVTVTPEQIYYEFSSGNPDPAAYRNFMKMLYDKASGTEEMPRYLLLFGDGSYRNFADGNDGNNKCQLLTYQSANSLRPVSSYVSDDYFGLLDDNEDIGTGLLDIGIGRFPVNTSEQAAAVINKIKRYYSSASSGSWQNNICFIADDEDGNIHMSQADMISSYINTNYPSNNLIKIYLDAYSQVTTSAGPRYPEVNKSIENTLNRGVLIMNYTGHGGKEGLSQEQIVRHEDIRNWKNSIYPLFVTATCEFSRFDDYEITTAGEDVFLNENGGGIGLLTTTRLVYSGPNFILNQEFYKYFSRKDSSGNYYRLGDLLRKTKNSSGTDINKLCFTLLGDPALRLANPGLGVLTTEIDQTDAGSFSDTLKAYREVTVKGIITDPSGNQATDFNGLIYPSLYDKEQLVKTLGNDHGEPFVFRQQESLLYKGKATVKNGNFEFSMVVPREIAYNYGKGKISYYAAADNMDASGYFDRFTIGGVSREVIPDNEGPEIHLSLNDRNFKDGGVTDQFPVLIADLNDENGINISGTGIGHDITGTLDNNTSGTFILNNFFESETDNYKKGSIAYKLPGLTPGKHILTLKAWDIFNNSTTAEITFEVADSSSLIVKNLHNFPNPFSGSTNFVFEHNQPGKLLDAELQIFSITGKMVYNEKMNIFSDGFTSGLISRDVNSAGTKLERGIYLYRFVFRYRGRIIVSGSEKMIVTE